MILNYINAFIDYGISEKLISVYDRQYVFNQLINMFDIKDPSNMEYALFENVELHNILEFMLDYASENGLISDNSITQKDLFDTKIMATITPYPGEVIAQFKSLYSESPISATDFFYNLCFSCNYIRRDRIAKDLKWKTSTEFGDIDITINLSKPEKDPRDIIAQRNAPSSSYPKCLLCIENEGYHGRINHPARQNLRLIPITLHNEAWSFQYSPYVYYNEHCIILNNNHIPMKISNSTFTKLLEFVDMFPHYFVGSNADLPIVGGSILSHDHFQGGRYDFAMTKAPIEKYFKIVNFEDVEIGILKWPMSVIRLRHKNATKIVELSSLILEKWRKYTDSYASIFAYTNDIPHNTITPIARKKDDYFEMDLVLRNNITTKEHPLGLYHPHDEYHHIKKENIGLIEVMGLAVLPSRLKEELKLVELILLKKADISDFPEISHHSDWISSLIDKYSKLDELNVESILQYEIGNIFINILSDAGVFKRGSKGQEAFERFIHALN
ncbi:MAG: UDP-glucose--hexose-1-phosphate uridylyltransferase [Proteocatella sp.]